MDIKRINFGHKRKTFLPLISCNNENDRRKVDNKNAKNKWFNQLDVWRLESN